MFPIQIDYRITLSDFRKATYYGLVVRYRRALLIMLIVLACVFELNSMFLVYVSSQDVFIVPKRALAEDQVAAVRKNFRARLKDRFSSRFEKKV